MRQDNTTLKRRILHFLLPSPSLCPHLLGHLLRSGEGDYRARLLLPHHLPQVLHGGGERGLGGNERPELSVALGSARTMGRDFTDRSHLIPHNHNSANWKSVSRSAVSAGVPGTLSCTLSPTLSSSPLTLPSAAVFSPALSPALSHHPQPQPPTHVNIRSVDIARVIAVGGQPHQVGVRWSGRGDRNIVGHS